MGLTTAIRGFLPNRQAQSAGGGVLARPDPSGSLPKNGVAGVIPQATIPMAPPLAMATPLQAPVADPRFIGVADPSVPRTSGRLTGATAVALAPNPSPAAAPPTPPPAEQKKLEANILNLFMETEAEKSPLQNLAGGLPEVDISSLYSECRLVKDTLGRCG